MADSKITDLTALTGANLATGDLFAVVDVSDTTMAASGTDKKITAAELAIGIAPKFTTPIISTLGAITTSTPFLSGTATWDANVTFESIVIDALTGSNFGISSNLIHLKRAGSTVFRVGGIDGSGNIGTVASRIQHTGDEWLVTTLGLLMGQTLKVRWSSTDFTTGSVDTGVGRNTAGVVEVNNGTNGTYRDILVRSAIFDGTPTTPAAGQVSIGGDVRTTIGANGGASALTANPVGYIDIYVGTTAYQIPYFSRGA